MIHTLDDLVEAARRKGPARIAIAGAHDPDAIEALKHARDLQLADGLFIGKAEAIQAVAASQGLIIPTDCLINEPDEAAAARRAIAMVREGKAQLLMKGKIGTASLVRAVLDRDTGLRTGRLLSQVIAFQVPSIPRVMLMSDAAINIAPTLEQKAEICRNAIDVAHAIGIVAPKVALLCALEFVNPEMPATIDAAALAMMNRRKQITGAYLEGPIALDVPLSRFAAERKGIESSLTEATDIFIAPDVEAANILFRAILYFARGESAGIVVGAKVPIILLSRAESAQTKIRSIALAMLKAGHA